MPSMPFGSRISYRSMAGSFPPTPRAAPERTPSPARLATPWLDDAVARRRRGAATLARRRWLGDAGSATLARRRWLDDAGCSRPWLVLGEACAQPADFPRERGHAPRSRAPRARHDAALAGRAALDR